MEMKKMSLKGQAVMEYLITYGLALFVILIVLAILVAVVLPSLRAPEACQFTQPGYTCNQKPHALVSDASNNVRILFQLDNTQGKSVVVSGVLCTSEATGNINRADIPALSGGNRTMSSGQSLTFGGAGADVVQVIPCITETGGSVALSPNSNFKGSLAIRYRFSEDQPAMPDRVAVATVTGAVQAG